MKVLPCFIFCNKQSLNCRIYVLLICNVYVSHETISTWKTRILFFIFFYFFSYFGTLLSPLPPFSFSSESFSNVYMQNRHEALVVSPISYFLKKHFVVETEFEFMKKKIVKKKTKRNMFLGHEVIKILLNMHNTHIIDKYIALAEREC